MTEVPNLSESRRIAMLVDGDNAQPSLLEEMIAETSKYGLLTIRRIYGDWTTTNMNSWKDSLNLYSIQPMQQFRYTVGKNATDSSMIIDAMDILYEGVVQGFCLVSSDSDYSRLAMRIREKGLFVMGIGRQSTPISFQNSCEVFVYTENLAPEEELAESRPLKPRDSDKNAKVLKLLKQAVEMSVQDDGWAFLGVVGNRLHQLESSFDPRSYGFRQLKQLFDSKKEFELEERKNPDGSGNMYVRYKKTP